ncbi:sulfotransferase [Nocardioides sp.]|uniref:sulfotransferase family protein n=1 Tax=Nocardioides sp. TaxID=35761 RepID=UPI0035612DC3
MSELVHIADLESPRFTPEVEEIRGFMEAMAADAPLDIGVLHDKARAETGLDDFGPEDYRERLEIFVAALKDIDGMHGPGILNFHMQILQGLKNRLLLTDLVTRHPEIRDIELVPPVVIAGLPRTGTTHLHNLLAAGPTFRVLRYWESLEPFPLASEVGEDPDPRLARTDMAVDFMNAAMPEFKLMHEMTTEHVHEEIQLLANDFSSMLMETVGHVPAWRDHYLQHDQTPHYEHLRLQLQALQHLRGGRRWLLKSPQHLEQLPVLESVFPGLTVVVTHRDPVPVTLSMVMMLCYSARMHRSPVEVRAIADYWVERLDVMLQSLLRDRDAIPAERSIDVRFDEFMADDLAVAAQVYELAGEELTAEASAAMADYLAGHQRGRLGRVATSPEMFGLDEQALRAQFAPYVERFLE